jgi:hypothetical protein
MEEKGREGKMTDLKQGEVVRCCDRYIERFWSTPLKDVLIGLAGIGGVTLVTWGALDWKTADLYPRLPLHDPAGETFP